MKVYINRAELKKKLEKKLSAEEQELARSDFHAWRTKCVTMFPIISGKDCPFACTYCYIQSMGFQFKKPEPLRLSGEQVCYALLENKEFIPGQHGTPLAFGHISEPLLPELVDNTLEYFKAISTYLGNPIQFSTKMKITPDLAKKIKGSLKHKLVSPLVTITTLTHARKLEPEAPSPEDRLKSITNLSKAGYTVFLYLRPLIPGVIEPEMEELLKSAKKAGATGVVGGGFRLTLPILNTMKKAGIDVSEIANRIPKIDDKQRYIYTKDLEEKFIQVATKNKLVALRSTKCALAYAADMPCTSLYWVYNKDMCTKCKPCAEQAPKIKKSEIDSILKEVFPNDEVNAFHEQADHIEIKVKLKEKTGQKGDFWQPRVLETYFRKRVVLQHIS